MRILCLQTTTFSSYGGIPTYNRLICRALNGLEFVDRSNVVVAMDSSHNISSYAGLHQRLQIEGFDGNRAKFARRVASLIVRHKVDLVLVGHVNYAPLVWGLKHLRRRLQYGVIIHGWDVWTELPALRKRALQQADFILSVSEYTKQRAIDANHVIAERVFLLPNTLECNTEDTTSPTANLFLPTGTLLLSVCRLDATEQQKGIDTVIKAMPDVITHVQDVQYIVVGGGTDLARHKQLAQNYGVSDRVHFLGIVDYATLEACYQACDIFVMPSAQEGFGIVFREAMQHRKPVIAVDSGGVPEVVEDRVTGSLIQYGDVSQLTQVLIHLCRNADLREAMGQAGYQRVQEHFSFSHFKQRLSDIMREVQLKQISHRSSQRSMVDETNSA